MYLARYRDILFPFIVECFLVHKPLIAAFGGKFFKVYNSKGAVLSYVSLLDCSIKMKSLKFIYVEI